VPFEKEGYGDGFQRDAFALVAAPKVAAYRGLVFASWDAEAMSLEDYLGSDLCWYLDNFLLDDPQGLEALPGRHRYLIPGNWKHLAENFGGDMYHFPVTHASVAALNRKPAASSSEDKPPIGAMIMQEELYSVTLGGETHPPHGLLALSVGSAIFEKDLQEAERLSPAAVEWVKRRQERRQAAVSTLPKQPKYFNNGNIWPNLSMNGIGSALSGRSLFVWHPRGPEVTEMMQWVFVDKSAPPEVKQHMSDQITVRQSATGIITADDIDNFQRMRDALHTQTAKSLDFNYDLALSADVETLLSYLPGRIGPAMTESYQRAFYRYWQGAMADE